MSTLIYEVIVFLSLMKEMIKFIFFYLLKRDPKADFRF